MILTFVRFGLALMLLTVLTTASWVLAAVEITPQKTLKTDGVPVDVAVTQDGNLTFVLTDSGSVLIYDQKGILTDTIQIGPHIDQMEIGPRGERLFVTSRKNKTVEIITLDFIHEINTLGAPTKGPPEASIVIVAFSDFQ